MADNSRIIGLRMQYDVLLKLSRRSSFITVTPLEVQPGWPPEKYIITYSCLGFAGIRGGGEPITSENHQMKIYLDHDYPRSEPNMIFLTPIWHPNISSQEPRKVCTDKVRSWWAGRDLDELIMKVGEMIQYKHYHARNEPPFPQDRTVAEWVLNYAEPGGLIGPDKPLDARPLLRSHRIRQNHVQRSMKRIRIGSQSEPKMHSIGNYGSMSGNVVICPKCGGSIRLKSTNRIKGGVR